MDVNELVSTIVGFRDARDWKQFHKHNICRQRSRSKPQNYVHFMDMRLKTFFDVELSPIASNHRYVTRLSYSLDDPTSHGEHFAVLHPALAQVSW
jgi:hypothetical protein